jgi:hypothetical protein
MNGKTRTTITSLYEKIEDLNGIVNIGISGELIVSIDWHEELLAKG